MEDMQVSFTAKMILSIVMVLWLLFTLILIAKSKINSLVYIIMILGFFSSIAFLVLCFILKKDQLSIGIWVIFFIVTALLTVIEFNHYFTKNNLLHEILMLGTMSLFFFVALIKFWNIIEVEQE